jgi:tetratricopeptide (TPR) repeat protein
MAVLVIALVSAALFTWQWLQPPNPALLIDADAALKDHRPDDALRLAKSYLAKAPKSAAALYLAALAADQRRQKDEVLEILSAVAADDSSPEAVKCANLAGKVCLEQGRVWDAEKHFRQALLYAPHDVTANRQMANMLTVEGRRWESRPYLLELISQRKNTFEELLILSDLWPVYENRAELKRLREVQPQDPLPLLVAARMEIHEKRLDKARDMIRKVLKQYPDLVEAHAWLGWTLVEDPKWTASLAAWEKELPAGASEHPMIWFIRGWGAERVNQPEAAVRCFWEVSRRDPNYDQAAYRLADALAKIKQAEAHDIVRHRAQVLLDLGTTVKKIHRELKYEPQAFRRVAEQMLSLGRWQEAQGWYLVIAAHDPSQSSAAAEAERLQERLKQGPFLSLAEAEPDLKLDFASFPLPKWPAAAPTTLANAKPGPKSAVRFIDSAAAAGINFTYYNGDLPGKARILGDLGGGVAILDYDGDFWQDIYLTQGADWPVDYSSTKYRDRLFRNLGNGHFEDVTLAAGLGDNSFSHGVCVGDFDNDGFPDLYLANCGVNRLYHNNGDGTFTDIAPQAGITTDDWTCSCLVADLNGDGLPDIYDVNYLEGDALTRICPNGPCGPHNFPAQQDRLLLNWGDGTFRDVTRQAGINGKDGKGLGIVAADFALDGRLSLFIANDTTPNFFYDNLTPPGDPIPRFSETAGKIGLGRDRNGLAQACMGVAADDATGDGFIELFITNFYNESNTLYVPEVPGQAYTDKTIEFGLRDGSLQMLGFGTQFIDGELDGWPDLILTNGHVHDRRKEGEPYKMRPQYYRNLRGESFEELSPDSLGPFFRGQYLGRGLARVDWNRDGREEVVISHIGSPVALLTNQTPTAGHFLALQLRGTLHSRDAIGAVAKVKIGERTITRQLTAGDGYNASNQRQLIFGLGSAEKIDQLEIRWLHGGKRTFTDLAIDTQYIAVEGRDSLVRLEAP